MTTGYGQHAVPDGPDPPGRGGYARRMSLLLVTDERFLEHRAGSRHPEQPARLTAVWEGLDAAGIGDAVVRREPRSATDADLLGVHPEDHLDRLVAIDAPGGGRGAADTVRGPGSWAAARVAAGAGLVAIEGLADGDADLAFCAVRPPGHHATPDRSMGFCLLNNVAVTASALVASGQRVAIVDVDAHHGNGTQDVFYEDDRVLFVSCHQWPLYPGTGAIDETGSGAGIGATINVPLPPGSAGDDYRHVMGTVVLPAVERFGPDWLLVSAGFDAHRDDPLTDMGLTSADYAGLVADLVSMVPTGRVVMFLEGGYDLTALADSTGATVAATLGVDHRPEEVTGRGTGGVADQVDALVSDLIRRHDLGG